MQMSIFTYREFPPFLTDTLQEKKRSNPRFSLRAWSRGLGYHTPSLLSDVLRGRRKIGPEMADRLSRGLGLSPKEHAYFHLLALRSTASTEREKEIYGELVACFHPGEGVSALDEEHFRLVSDWYHSALLAMVALEDFRLDYSWLSRRLGVAPALLEQAMERLKALRLVSVDKEGRVSRTKKRVHVPSSRVPSETLRKMHRQMTEKALEAIDQQPIDERYLFGSTVALSEGSYRKVCQLVEQFHDRLNAIVRAAPERAQEVYRINTQVFRLTQGGNREKN